MHLKNSLFILVFIYLNPPIFSKEQNIFESDQYIIKNNIKVEVKKETQNFMFTSFDVAISQPYMEIVDIYGKKINELKGITYTYINALAGIGAAAAISFDIPCDVSKKYEIKKLNFLSPDDGYFIYYLHKLASGKQKSKKEDTLDAHSFGVLKTSSLSKTVARYYRNGNWYYIIAELTVKNKETNKKDIYKIRLNPKIYNDFEKKIQIEYKDLKIIKNFPIPVESE